MTDSSVLPVYNRAAISFEHGDGSWLYEAGTGRKFLDFGAGIAVNAFGHAHPHLVQALIEQGRKLWHVSNLYQIPEMERMASRLANASFADQVFFCNSGAESVECAIKMIRRHFYAKNEAKRNRIITFEGAFHGRTIATISAACKERYIEGFEPRLSGFDNVPFGDIDAVRDAITDETAAVLIEPIQGEEGIRAATPEFMQQLRKLCTSHGLLLALDEVQCGMGRSGYLFAHEHYKITPDIVASAKAIGGGFPLGACLATYHAASGMGPRTHGTTYGGNPLAMAVGNAVLDLMFKNGFLDDVKSKSRTLRLALEQLISSYPGRILEVRGLGMMLGIKINPNWMDNLSFNARLLGLGLLAPAAGENVIRIMPPLNIKHDEIITGVRMIDTALKTIS